MSSAPAAQPSQEYLPDQAAKVDHFERRDFARRLADTIVKRRQEECLTVSIVGSWGSGKSTVLDMMTEELDTRTADEGTCLLVNFNPWKYSGQDTLLYHLFEAMVKRIDPDLKVLTTWQNMKRNASKARKWLSAGGGAMSHAYMPGSGGVTSGLLNAILPEEFKAHVDELKVQTADHLKGSNLRMVVLLDDVDRLEAEEILLLFRSLKLVADLPNTTFVIAMDEDHVSQIICRQLDGRPETGRKYLEKIINVRLKLPIIPPEVLEEYALEKLFKVWKDSSSAILPEDSSRVRSIFSRLHAPFVRTPRTVKAIANAFQFALGMLVDELHPGDVLLLEATRLLHPQLYEKIPEVIPTLPTSDGFEIFDTLEDRHEPRHQAWEILAGCLTEEVRAYKTSIQDALEVWFPQLGSIITYDAEYIRRRQFICSPDYFWRYFSMGIQKKDVHDARVRGWCALAEREPAKADASLTEHLSKPYARVFLKKVKNFCETDWTARQAVILSLVRVTSQKPAFQQSEDWRPSFWRTSAELAAEWVRTLTKEDRVMAALELVKRTEDVDWNMTLGDYLRNDDSIYNFKQLGQSPGKLDEEMAEQSLAAYENGKIPESNVMICFRVWCLYRHLSAVKKRLEELAKQEPIVALHLVTGPCTFSRSVQGTGWQWEGMKELTKVEHVIPRAILKIKLQEALPEPRPANLGRNAPDSEIHTLQEVGWLCLDTIAEAEKLEAAGAIGPFPVHSQRARDADSGEAEGVEYLEGAQDGTPPEDGRGPA
ncbi:P-loop NTPase fold protein [Prosthecobacter sp. SYSU 5D2]|uniref:KAP family P-loop NTPase fold protein n=1 Tax=Prosthecobacter sp. SYSU 5D2 TaxID=3134134 RepID=UPI0031FED9A0